MKRENAVRYFGPLKKWHVFLIRKWRNEQMDVLRQRKKIRRSEQIKWFKALKKDKTQRLFAIFDGRPPGGVFIGYCGLTHIDYPNSRAEVSFLVDTKRAKEAAVYKKDMFSALAFLADYAFSKLGFEKIFTETYEFRKGHIKILEEFGFKKEGVLRSQLLLRGRFYDSLVHSMLKMEFRR